VVGRGVTYPTQQVGIILARINPAQGDRLIAAQASGAIHGTTGANAILQARLCSDDEKCARLSEKSHSSEIQIPSVHHADRSGLERQLVQDVDLENYALCQRDKCWDGAAQIQVRVQFDRRFRRAKISPREMR